jgi:hypothetical protein
MVGEDMCLLIGQSPAHTTTTECIDFRLATHIEQPEALTVHSDARQKS